MSATRRPCPVPPIVPACCRFPQSPLGDGPLPEPAGEVARRSIVAAKDYRTNYPVCFVRRVDGTAGLFGLPLFELALHGPDGMQRSTIAAGARWVATHYPELLQGKPEPGAEPDDAGEEDPVVAPVAHPAPRARRAGLLPAILAMTVGGGLAVGRYRRARTSPATATTASADGT